MLKNKYERIIDQFSQYYPGLYEKAIDWWASSSTSILVKIDNDTAVEYDSLDNSIRYVRLDRTNVTTEELRLAFGSNLQKLLPHSGLNKMDLAAKIGTSSVMMSRYVAGTSMPSVDKAYQIARAIGCRIDDLFDNNFID